MITALFTKIGYKLMTLLIAIFFSLNGYVGPASNQPIQNSADTSSKLTFAAWADPQVSNYIVKRTPYFDAACEDLSKNASGIDALLIAGDIAENGLNCEYQYISEKLSTVSVKNYIFSVGNHDVRMKLSYKNTVKTFTQFQNALNSKVGSTLSINSLNYSYVLNGYTFIVLGTDKTEFEESYFSDAQLQWLDETLSQATAKGLPAFVVCHQPLKFTHGLPDTWNSPVNSAGSVGKQSDELKTIMNKYQNVFFITGHLHTGIGKYTYEKIGNINSVNLPSLTINNKDGNCDENGIGFMVEVYNNRVLFRARNFAQGKYEPEYDIEVPLV
jgi:3',5'-cyclic AMP phosphodiesterase CpdA